MSKIFDSFKSGLGLFSALVVVGAVVVICAACGLLIFAYYSGISVSTMLGLG